VKISETFNTIYGKLRPCTEKWVSNGNLILLITHTSGEDHRNSGRYVPLPPGTFLDSRGFKTFQKNVKVELFHKKHIIFIVKGKHFLYKLRV